MLNHASDSFLSCHTACRAVRGRRRARGAVAATLPALSAWWRVRAFGGPPDCGFYSERVRAHAGVVEDERSRRAAAARAHAEELGALHSKPPAAWPPTLRSLVAQREAAAAAVRPLQSVNRGMRLVRRGLVFRCRIACAAAGACPAVGGPRSSHTSACAASLVLQLSCFAAVSSRGAETTMVKCRA